ncbi:long-chain-fatty-acid--CoA ligase 5 isoform X1 [Dermacentor silvarum]|uniref:long-chain-fatty-acid--CoA ligase 5 isoform X1 n=1 Tax=Dermacentor silvarum TaxID=543639 RepID=UPI00210090D1|nr:long-chain-fatty-acid--CoA ligase 5 isoform X1 [Dermacentor silvarum]
MFKLIASRFPGARMKCANRSIFPRLHRAESRRSWMSAATKEDLDLILCQSTVLPVSGPQRIRVGNAGTVPETGVTTVYEALLQGQRMNRNKKVCGYWSKDLKELHWISYEELLEKCQMFGSGLLSLGQVPRESIVMINCKTGLEYVISNYSLSHYSMVSCPVTANADLEATTFVLQQVESSVLVCDSADKVQYFLSKKDSLPALKTIVCADDISRDVIAACRSKGMELVLWSDCLKLGSKSVQEPIPPTPDMLYGLLYTSGTTGMPKGVPVTHRRLVKTAIAINHLAGPMRAEPGHICFCYLPTGHIYEHIYEVTTLMRGATLGFYRGNVQLLLDDMKALKPHNLPMVPRLLNRIYYKVHSEVHKSAIKTAVFNFAVNQKRKLLKKGIVTTDTIWDKYVFKKIRDELGGNFKYGLTTSAPAKKEVLEFFRCVFGCHLVEVYGSTEASVVSSTLPYDFVGGDNVGCLFPEVQMKLVDVPDMNYFAKDDKGEICVRSPLTFQGYYKNPKETANTVLEGGWVLTGDIGMCTSTGALKVIDRKKDFFKLSQGEFISPDRIESVYSMMDYIATIFVTGCPTQSFCVAIVIPHEEPLRDLAASCGLNKKAPLSEICKNLTVRKTLLKEMQKHGKESGLSSLHQAHNVHLHIENDLLASGLVTNTLKLKRNVARQQFANAIQDLYSEGQLLST